MIVSQHLQQAQGGTPRSSLRNEQKKRKVFRAVFSWLRSQFKAKGVGKTFPARSLG